MVRCAPRSRSKARLTTADHLYFMKQTLETSTRMISLWLRRTLESSSLVVARRVLLVDLSTRSPANLFPLINQGHKLKRLRRRRSASDASDASGPTGDLNNIFDDDERGGDEDRYGGQELFDADEMAGFIEDDTQSESSGRHGSGSEDEDDRAARKAMKKKQRQKEKTKGRGRRAGFGAGFVEGITAEAWQEVTDVFGNGTDYAYALEDDAENQGEKELKDVRLSLYHRLRICLLTLPLSHRSSNPPRLPLACSPSRTTAFAPSTSPSACN